MSGKSSTLPASDKIRAHASVIVRSASGKSAKHPDEPIAPQNVKSYMPSGDSLRKAALELRKLGFAIDLVAPTHVSISGDPALFERTFGARLSIADLPIFARSNSKARQHRFVAERPLSIPAALAPVIEAVDLAPPISLFTTATAPALSYDHLEVPIDVARGMDAVKAHERGITGLGIRLAMVDTGFMTPLHPYYVGKGYTLNPVDSYPGDATPGDDSYGHGSGISACALAVAPGVDYTVHKMNLSGSATEAFSRAAMAGPHIITNSWGTGFDTALRLAINNAVANGTVVLFASGNGGSASWPGSEPAVISVGGAFLGSDDSITASSYASSGTNSNNPGRQCPDLCGLVGMMPQGIYIALPTQPGSTVDSDFGTGAPFPDGDETPSDDGWVVASGTSSATPMVAGTCALMMQADPTLLGNPAGIRAALVASCVDVSTGGSANGDAALPGPDGATGAGLVQAYRAVRTTDIWMRDNPDSDIGLVPTTGRRPASPPFAHWTSPDIKVVAAQLADPQADFDGAAEASPIFGQDNFVYMRVRNRGREDASNVVARLYYADPSTSLAFPHDWHDGSTGVAADGSLSVSGATSNSQTLAIVPANGSLVTPVAFVWRPPNPSTATQSQTLPDGRVVGHFCLLSRLTDPDDTIIFPGGGESSVINDNNLSMKNEHVYSAPAGMGHFFNFVVRRSEQMKQRQFTLVADASRLPAETEITLTIPKRRLKVTHTVRHHDQTPMPKGPRAEPELALADAGLGRGTGLVARVVPQPATLAPAMTPGKPSDVLILASVVLAGGEELLARVIVALPGGTAKGQYDLPIAQDTAGRPVGGVTLVSRVV